MTETALPTRPFSGQGRVELRWPEGDRARCVPRRARPASGRWGTALHRTELAAGSPKGQSTACRLEPARRRGSGASANCVSRSAWHGVWARPRRARQQPVSRSARETHPQAGPMRAGQLLTTSQQQPLWRAAPAGWVSRRHGVRRSGYCGRGSRFEARVRSRRTATIVQSRHESGVAEACPNGWRGLGLRLPDACAPWRGGR